MSHFMVLAAMTIAYFGLQALLRRCRLPVLWAVFFLVPLALTPYWIITNQFDAFQWIKIYSIMFCVSWGGWLRFTSAGDHKLLRHTIVFLLAGNIIEALVLDCLGSGAGHTLNALAGVLLLLTMPWSAESVRIDRTGPHQDLLHSAPLPWIVGYTLWNWAFVYLNYPAFAGHHTAVLLAALLVAFIHRERWLQARAATLGPNLLLMATSYRGTLAVSDTSGWRNEGLAVFAASLAFAWMVSHAASRLSARRVLRPFSLLPRWELRPSA